MGTGQAQNLGGERRKGLYEIRLEQDETAWEDAGRREVGSPTLVAGVFELGKHWLTHSRSVVQRQMWLMENQGRTKVEAYDIARKEFYDLRMREDIERRVTAEEALSVGAKFGKSYMDIGIELEQRALEQWKEKAIALLQLKRGRQAAFSGTTEEDPATAATPEVTPGAAEGVAVPAAAAAV